jgi:hypothetical protein
MSVNNKPIKFNAKRLQWSRAFGVNCTLLSLFLRTKHVLYFIICISLRKLYKNVLFHKVLALYYKINTIRNGMPEQSYISTTVETFCNARSVDTKYLVVLYMDQNVITNPVRHEIIVKMR